MQYRCPRYIVPAVLIGVSVLVPALLGRMTSATATPPATGQTVSAALSGKVSLAYPVTEQIAFTYAVLYIDGASYGMANTLPLRFDIRTTDFADGVHSCKVVLFDDGGIVKAYPPFPMAIANTKTAQVTPTTMTTVKSTTPPPKMTAVTDIPPFSERLWRKATKPAVFLDGNPFRLGMPAFIVQDRTMALLRPLITASGGWLDWKGNAGTAVVQQRQIHFTMNSNVVVVDGKNVTLVRPLIRFRDRVYVPITIWGDLFSGDVEYGAHPNYAVRLTKSATATARTKTTASR